MRKDIMPEEWELCMDSWILMTETYLLVPTDKFTVKIIKDPSVAHFLVSYVKTLPTSPHAKLARLRRSCFLMVHRILTDNDTVPAPLLEWTFWTNLSLAYANITALSELLSQKWIQLDMDSNKSMSRYKSTLTRALEVGHLNPELEQLLPQTLALLRACYPYGQFLMLGSDLVDALSTAYEKKPRLQKKILAITYFCLLSLIEPKRPRTSALLDHLYSLNSSDSKSVPLLKAVIGSTPLLQKMRSNISGPESGRAKSLFESLKVFERTSDGRPKKHIRRKVDKFKGKEKRQYLNGSLGDMHVHNLSLISQVQDLFPDLGAGFVMKLLDEYDDDTEQVTAHLLDDSLPTHLKECDRSETLHQTRAAQDHDLAPNLAPHATPPLLPTRRNIHDDDDFDRLAVDTSKLRLGKDQSATADDMLASKRDTGSKAAILSALAAFDSDDDERDDTYDVEDVGGTVDTTADDNAADLKLDVHEEALFNAYNMTPDLFNRDAETRRSKARAELKSETGMTDEAIEGWGIMVGRDPRRLDRLKRKFEMGNGSQQRALEGTAWRADSGTEDSDAGGARGGRGGGGRARGRGQGAGAGRGRGGEVAGPSDDRGTQVARQRKDAGKGSRANHNRRDQRAKKMTRGGFPG
jgi:activating signal cointegrator complex subunit 2